MEKARKREIVQELGKIFADSGSVIVCHYTGLTVKDMEALRSEMREAGGQVRVAKNRLAKIALQEQPNEGLSAHLTGQTMLAFAKDPVTPAKVVVSYAKTNDKLVIVGGAMGPEIMDPNGVKALAAMPSREEVLAAIVGALMAPGANIAGALNAPGAGIAGAIASIVDKQDA